QRGRGGPPIVQRSTARRRVVRAGAEAGTVQGPGHRAAGGPIDPEPVPAATLRGAVRGPTSGGIRRLDPVAHPGRAPCSARGGTHGCRTPRSSEGFLGGTQDRAPLIPDGVPEAVAPLGEGWGPVAVLGRPAHPPPPV